MTRILLTGKNGQIGWELQRTLATLGQVIALDRNELDLADPDSIRRGVRDHRPHLIVNAAAYTKVDKAEEEPALAMAINGVAPGILAEEAKRLGAAMIHYSTDYVFDGDKNAPYAEEDVPNPLNVYGKTKLAGERAIQAAAVSHLILRTSWVYGMRGKNFLLTMLRLAKEHDEMRVVNDQFGAPTWCRLIAEATAQVAMQSYLTVADERRGMGLQSGVYHLTAGGSTSWFGFAKTILDTIQHPKKVIPIPSLDYPLPAVRPVYSVLAHVKLRAGFGITLSDWRDGLWLCLDKPTAGGSRLDNGS